jgi:predicted CXXCH cytochrome family protein
MAPPVTGRQRASRIPLDYFKTPSLWERRKLAATVVMLAAAAAWWTAGILLGRPNAFFSPDSLASVHHTWESQCSACHADFQPIRDDAVGTRWEGGTLTSDEKCQACHEGAEHHPLKKGSEAPGCSSCHREHQGLQASLLRLDDRACTRCHSAIPEYMAGDKPLFLSTTASITRFGQNLHPEFSSAQEDYGHLKFSKFSHYHHLTPGLVNDVRDDKTVSTLRTLARISPNPALLERYRRGQSDDAPVQLDCGSCHQLDRGDFQFPGVAAIGQAALPARPAGSYMLPITYENQCQACHPLYKVPGIVQHRQTPEEIRTALYRAFAEDYVRGNPKLLETPFVPPEPLPNIRPTEAETVARVIQAEINTAQRELSQVYCVTCHDLDATKPGLPPVVPTQVRQVWYEHAKFDHRAHRAMDCRQCHPGVYPDDPRPSRESKDLLLPKLEVCLQCHSPPSGSGSASRGGARFDCVECHRYHNGSAPMAGSGAKAGNPVRTLSEEEFEEGKARE